MRKNLITLLVSLTICGGATAATIIATTARAQVPRQPVMVAMMTPSQLALRSAAPPPDGAGDQGMMPSPAEMAAHRGRMCNDHYAHMVGEMAYLETKLNLTPAQTSAFARWKDARLAIAKRDMSDCGARPAHARGAERPSPVAMMAHEEDMLKRRLADLSAERPALEALYNTLTPAQRESFAHDGEGGPHRMMLGMMGPMHGPMGRMHGPMGDGPNPPPGPDGPPPER